MNAARRLAAVLAVLLCTALAAQDAAELQARRLACRKLLGEGQALLLRGSSERTARQDSDFYYLTGIEHGGQALLLGADGSDILFTQAGRTGRRAATPPIAGFTEVRSGSQLDALLADPGKAGKLVDGPRAGALLAKLRRIKSPAEIERLRTAIDITCSAHKEVMRTAEPGLCEYQLQAVLEFVFALHGSKRCGFPSIVGSGPNSCILHWSENTRQTEAGDLVVVDIGAEYAMYTGDATRTIPISGRFTERQRQVYEIVLAANEAAIAMVGPGANMRDVSARAEAVLAEWLAKLGVLEAGDRSGLRRYYSHGLSHPIGLQVHDVGGLGELAPGMVITIEPGLYFGDENMGIRIEDDVLVTADGREVLSKAAPKTVAEIEALMQAPGIDLQRIRGR